MRFARKKNTEKNDQTIDDIDQNYRVHMRNHLQQDQNDIHFHYTFDHDLRLDSMTHAQEKKIDIENKLTMLQNKCLQTITKIFRVTLVLILKSKIHIISMSVHLNQLQTQTRLRLRIDLTSKFIADTCKVIIYKFRDRTKRKRKHRLTSDELNHV